MVGAGLPFIVRPAEAFACGALYFAARTPGSVPSGRAVPPARSTGATRPGPSSN